MTGITPEIDKRLIELGITRFFQIARWNAASCEAMDDCFGLPCNQINEQNWVQQAQAPG